jgi:hypothetical protein
VLAFGGVTDELLLTWFSDMRIDQAAFDASTWSKNRRRRLDPHRRPRRPRCGLMRPDAA